ncbi:MAG: hypothetical protein QOE70_713 [Chthoniobacter sp.]|jgi:hypothetical protein|nr:hypothetical protein [Chthoniobacter sp.]
MIPSPILPSPLVPYAASHVLTFSAEGTCTTLWTDKLPLAELGTMRMRRASWIDFNEHTQGWEVRFDPHAADFVFSDPSREACLAWEHEKLNQS